MNNILLVSSSQNSTESLIKILKENGFCNVEVIKSGAKARRSINKTGYPIVMINTPLSDEIGTELALTFCEKTTSGILLLIKAEIADTIAAKVEKHGVIVIPKPFTKQQFTRMLFIADAMMHRMETLRKENTKLLQKIEEIRIVSKAKYQLMEFDQMTEAQAHRYIEKKAMDNRMTKRESADEIINLRNV